MCSLHTITVVPLEQYMREWVSAIGFFRDHCADHIPVAQPDLEIADIKRGEVEMEEEEAKDLSSRPQAPVDNKSQMDNVAGLAVDALEKETKYEKMAESEELDREVLEEINDRKKVEEMKAANECQERDERRA